MMKKTIFTLTLCFSVIFTSLYASFPVSKGDAPQATEQQVDQPAIAKELQTEVHEFENFSTPEHITKEAATEKFREDDWILLALFVFLWGFAAHRWYAGKPVGWNILFILTAGGCGIWALVDLINILRQDFD